MAALFLSFLIPCVSTWLLPTYYYPEAGSFLDRIDGAVRHFAVTGWLAEPWGHHLIDLLVISILGLGFVLATAKYVYSLGIICRFLKGSRIVSKNGQYTLRAGNQGEGSFCFLKTIYLNAPSLNEQNINVILEHEKAHIRQRHYIDVCLSAMCDFFLWYCPFTKQFQLAWEEVLECLADREAIRTLRVEPIVYQSVLYANVEYSSVITTINHAFGRSMVARRLLFISRKPSNVGRILPRLFFSFVAVCLITSALAVMDGKIFQLQKINEIRNAGYDLHEVTTGYVLDGNTKRPVTQATVRSEHVSAVTDNAGFFFIEKSSSISVLHIAYNRKNTTAANGSIIRMEPAAKNED
jgi:hypothetical protein